MGNKHSFIFLLVFLYAGCGRVGFDRFLPQNSDASSHDGDRDGGGDADTTSPVGEVILPPTNCTWTEFSAPSKQPLQVLNTLPHNYFPTVSADGLTMYLTCNRPEWTSIYRIYKSVRSSVDAPFGDPFFVSTDINGVDPERSMHPMLSFDGLRFYWSSNRAGSSGFDIWQSSRADLQTEFSAAERLDAINSIQSEASVFESSDGLRLYYATRRNSSVGFDIWMSERAAISDEFPAAGTPLALNSTDNDQDAVLSHDELEIIFSSDRTGGLGNYDLWRATRLSTDEPFANIENLSQLNSTGDEAGAELSPDGRTLYFNRDGSVYFGGGPERELWVSTRDCI